MKKRGDSRDSRSLPLTPRRGPHGKPHPHPRSLLAEDRQAAGLEARHVDVLRVRADDYAARRFEPVGERAEVLEVGEAVAGAGRADEFAGSTAEEDGQAV